MKRNLAKLLGGFAVFLHFTVVIFTAAAILAAGADALVETGGMTVAGKLVVLVSGMHLGAGLFFLRSLVTGRGLTLVVALEVIVAIVSVAMLAFDLCVVAVATLVFAVLLRLPARPEIPGPNTTTP